MISPIRVVLLASRPILNLLTAERIKNRLTFANSIDVGCGSWLPVGQVLGSTLADVPEYDAHDLDQIEDGKYDLVICCNVLEHLHTYPLALREFRRIGNKLYLGWTPWGSPWGKHGITKKSSGYTLGKNLFKTNVDQVLKDIEAAGWKITDVRPRYWPALKFLAKLPWGLKDFFCWNVEVWAE